MDDRPTRETRKATARIVGFTVLFIVALAIVIGFDLLQGLFGGN